MKSTFSLLLFGTMLTFGLQSQAANRTVDAMRAEAQNVLRQNGMLKAPVRSGVEECSLLAEKTQMMVFGYTDGGYAYISKDDKVPAVLFYSDGNFNDARENPVLQSYLSALDDYLNGCAADGVRPSFIQEKATWANAGGVSPIVKSSWGQSTPYNILCPLYNGSHTLTGCVATAAAQAIRALGAPVTLHGKKRYVYTDDGNNRATVTQDLTDLSIDYDNLIDTYGSTENYLQRKAVSELMFACGVVGSMDYSLDGSGTYLSRLNNGLNTYFQGIKSTYYGQVDGNEQVIYDELDAGRAVVYSGYTSDNAGHAFVIDGYNKSGNVHVNLGWSGSGDCYTTLANMAGYGAYPSICCVEADESLPSFSADEPLEEISGKYVMMDMDHPAEEIEPGKWYGLYSVGRAVLAYSSGVGNNIRNTAYVPSNDPSSVAAPLIVRFVEPESGKGYYIQTGAGDYFGKLKYAGNNGTTANPSSLYTTGHIQESVTSKYFYFKNSGYVLDCNGESDYDDGLAGFGTVASSDTLANSCWQLLPVEFSDVPFEKFSAETEAAKQQFDPSHHYNMMLVTGNNSKFYVCTDYSGNVDDVAAPVRISNSAKRAASFVCNWNGYGWELQDTEGRYLGIGANISALGTELPETWFFVPTENADEYRINNGCGYLGVDKRGIGAALYRDKAADWNYGVWRMVDLDTPDGIRAISQDSENNNAIYDLQGRRVVAPSAGHIYIHNGKKFVY